MDETALLIIKAFEDTFLGFENLTFGAAPGIRHLFPGRSRGNTIFRIPLDRIIDIMTFQADPPGILCVNRHMYSLQFLLVASDLFTQEI